MKINLLTFNKDEILKKKKNTLLIGVLVLVFDLVIDVIFLFIHTRGNSIYFKILASLLTTLAICFLIYIIQVKIGAYNSYLFILKKEHAMNEENLIYKGFDDDIVVKNKLSYKKYYFVDNKNKEINFYAFYDIEINLKEDSKVKVSYIDDIACKVEVIDDE